MASYINFDIYFDSSVLTEEESSKVFVDFKYFFCGDIDEIDSDNYYLVTTWAKFIDAIEYISKEYPKVLFRVYGKGGDNDDLFLMYIKDGFFQMEEAVVTYGEYNLKKMKPIVVCVDSYEK